MTSEDDFQAALDASPEDWQTRLVFADWLEERGDERAEGYRALGLLRRYTVDVTTPRRGVWTWFTVNAKSGAKNRELPHEWFKALGSERVHWADYRSRREAEDAAALAFARLPPERRAELLASRGEG